MMKILTAQQMRDIDRLTVEGCGIPFATLMETAGARVVEAIIENYGSVAGKTFVIYCGKGNNGGDGAVIARLLWMRGAARVHVYLFASLQEVKEPARTNFEAVARLSEESNTNSTDNRWITFLEVFSEEETQFAPSTDFIVDALFGTGLARPADGIYATAINTINRLHKQAGAQVIAVDIPSGLSSDQAHPIGLYVQADLTVSFTAPKIGNVLAPANFANGKLVVSSIGTPDYLLNNESGAALNLLDKQQCKDFLLASRRSPDAHKSSVGDVLLIAGSQGKTGAAALCSEAILRAGAGLVTVATSASALQLLVHQAKAEIMTEPLRETANGTIAHEALALALLLAEKRTVLAIGPGLSSDDKETRKFVYDFVAHRKAPIVIDADGLNALAPWPENLRGSNELPIIITPHPGEMARLVNQPNAKIVADRLAIASEFAARQNVITVLKGARTIIAAPNGDVFVNPTGNAGMATAGSGDVLTGMIAGLLAQLPQAALEATVAGVYLHGLAGDLAAEKLGQRSLIASDIINHIHQAILRFE